MAMIFRLMPDSFLIKEFAARIGLLNLIKNTFKTNDHTQLRRHIDADNFMQLIYQIIAGYFEDDCADELTNDPILTTILEKMPWLHSQCCHIFGIAWTKIALLSLNRWTQRCGKSSIPSNIRNICCLTLILHSLTSMEHRKEKVIITIIRPMVMTRCYVSMGLPVVF